MIHPEKEKDKINFLYQIVCNGKNGVDVDKFDYIARDTKALGIQYGFDHKRIFPYCKVINGEICFCNKVIFNIFELFDTRYRLHKQVYSHPTVKKVDMMMEQIFDNLSVFLRPFGEPFANDNLDNFLKLTDSILDYPFLIEPREGDPDEDKIAIRNSREIITNLRTRKLIPILESIPLKTGDNVDEILDDWMKENQVDPRDYQHCLRKLSFSAGTRNPLNYVKFYKKDSDELLSRPEIKQVVGNILPRTFEEVYLLIFRK